MILFGHVKFPVAIAFNLKSTANQTRSRCFAGTVHQNVIPLRVRRAVALYFAKSPRMWSVETFVDMRTGK